MKNDFSKQSSERLMEHTQKLFYKSRKDVKIFSTQNSIYTACSIFIWVMFFINIFFYFSGFMGVLFELERNKSLAVIMTFIASAVSLILIITGIVIYKLKSKFIGALLMAFSTVIKYFAVYGTNLDKFDFSVNSSNNNSIFGANTTMFFMHFLPMLLLFVGCSYIILTNLVEKAKLKKQFAKVCDIVYSIKSDDQFGFTSQEDWDRCVEKYLSGEYKNFKKPKKSLRKKNLKNKNQN